MSGDDDFRMRSKHEWILVGDEISGSDAASILFILSGSTHIGASELEKEIFLIEISVLELYLISEQQQRRLLNMKKLLLVAAMAVLALNMALWGASINVTSPNASSEWCIGSAHNITWGSSGVTGTVDVILRTTDPSAPPVLGIAAATANDGTLNWSVPASVAPGTYLIRIRSNSDPSVYDDSVNFIIKDCSTGSITVTNPNGNGWCIGRAYTITWTSSGFTGHVDIILRKAGAPSDPPVLGIASDIFNDGTKDWSIPNTVPVGDYLIRIRSVNTPAVYDDSPNFHIGHCVEFPHDWWKKKYMVEVRWPWPPDPDPRPEWDIREIIENIPGNFVGSLVLLKNGKRVQELGAFGRGKTLPNVISPSLGRANALAMKNGTAKFSMGIFDNKGNLVQEIQMQGEQQLR